MTDEPQISILDARLAEIDRRLRTIQTGLADDVGAEADPRHGLPPKIAVPEPSDRPEPAAARPVALAPPVPKVAVAHDASPDENAALVVAELRRLVSDHGRLLDAMGELLAAGERLLARAEVSATAGDRSRSPVGAAPGGSASPEAPAPGGSASPEAPATGGSASPEAPATGGSPSQVTVVAGPFARLETVRDFERTLGTLPDVASVQARGYEGGDRAILDVHLSPQTP